MAQPIQEFSARLESRFATELLSCTVANGEVTVEVAAGSLTALARALRDEPEFGFAQLVDVCGVDYSTYGQADWKTDAATDSGFSRGVDLGGEVATTTSKSRFAVVYHLLSIEHNQRLRVRAFPDGNPPTIDSVVDLWASANWFERETFDLFGILFDGHPDLRRILTDYGFIGHPFRKDFPLEGNVEVRYDPSKGRVVYQPVTIENRVLVPRVIRNESSPNEAASSEDPGDA